MNATITFDTLAFAQNLIDAGFTDKQAKALTQFQKEAIGQSMETTLATKADFYELKEEMHNMKSDLTLVKYMLGVVIAMLMTLVMKFVFN